MKKAINTVVVALLAYGVKSLARFPRLEYLIASVVRKSSLLKRLQRIHRKGQEPKHRLRYGDVPKELQQLTPRARRIYADLNRLSRQRQRD
jgi:flagellar biosynthesis/type III secretory pathway chaperone